MSRLPFFRSLASSLIICGLSGCSALPGGQVVDAALIVHTEGSSQHMVAVKVPVDASIVFAALIDQIEGRPDVSIINRNDKAYLLEVSKGERHVTGQVTELDAGRSLLYVWADTGDSHMSGHDLAISVVEVICDDLGVIYERVEY
jgi:hypothetical protein